MSIKTLREHLAEAQSQHAEEWPIDVWVKVADLIRTIDRHRPLGPDGEHGDRHTRDCGCEDK